MINEGCYAVGYYNCYAVGYYNCYAVGFIKTPILVTYFSTKDSIFTVNQHSHFSTIEAYYDIVNFNYHIKNIIHYCDCHIFYDYHTELIATT